MSGNERQSATDQRPVPPEPGRLVLAICHEAGNLVSAIRLGAHMLDESLPPKALAAASVEVDDLAARVGVLVGLVRPLLEDERPRSQGAFPANVMEGLRRELQAQGGRGVVLSVEPCPELAEVAGQPETLHQLLLLLAYYALDACRPRGAVTLRAEPGEGGQGICFSVTDTGPEDPELAHIDGRTLRGRTLVCALAARVCARLGGRFEVVRTPDETRCRLVLPRL